MAEANTATAKEATPRVIQALHPSRRTEAEYKRRIHFIIADIATEPEDMLSAAYWSHIAAELKEFDLIEAHAEDGKWDALLRVLDAGQNWAKVHLIWKTRLESVNHDRRPVLLAGHSVNHGGAISKWRVVRDADSKVLRDKFVTEGDAYAWLSEYAKSVAN